MERPRIPRGPVSHAFKIGAIAAAVRFLLICLHFLHTAVHVSCKKRHISSLLTQFMYHIRGRIYVSHMSLLLIFSASSFFQTLCSALLDLLYWYVVFKFLYVLFHRINLQMQLQLQNRARLQDFLLRFACILHLLYNTLSLQLKVWANH